MAKINTLQIMEDCLARAKSNDCGAIGKAFELATHLFITPTSNVERATKAGTWYGDILKTVDGERMRIEVKTGCGELAVIDSGEFTENDLLVKADLIIYCPEFSNNVPVEQQGFVFTRNEFLEMINSYSGSGSLLRVKPATKGGLRVSFQSFYSETRKKASKKIANHIWDNCYNQPTVEEFFGK